MGDAAARAARIRLVIFDIDGVFTDGRLYLDGAGDEVLKVFHVRDGYGIKQLLAAGVEVAIISGRNSRAVERRMTALGVRHVHQGIDDKLPVLRGLLAELGIASEETAYVGDDEPDLPAMQAVGLAVAVADAHARVAAASHWSTRARGGEGAVREVCEYLIAARSGT
jgi:3-deoxy-D-manno-octulosonate 8-phosphate phosphatase (KDO 8-P phosphatase)